MMGFGIRSVPPCEDCWEDGHCSMNCGPKLKASRLIPSHVHLILLYPHQYKRINRNGTEIYVEDFTRCGRSYDKHFWADAQEVDDWRKKLEEEEKCQSSSSPST